MSQFKDEKWILITGASTGIGRACTEYLASNGFKVYAGARKQEDLDSLDKIENVISIKLDVTVNKDVEDAFKFVEEKGTGLIGIISNAGIAEGGPLIDVTDEQMLKVFNVNILGAHKVIRAFSPFIIKSKGRIVMMSSYMGVVSYPFFGPYCLSKSALEAYSDSLRREMDFYDVDVVVIQAGLINTPLWDKAVDMLENYRNNVVPVDKKIYDIFIKFSEDTLGSADETAIEPIEIAEGVYEALTIEKPKTRYLITENNMQHKLSFSLSDKMLDKLVAKQIKKFDVN